MQAINQREKKQGSVTYSTEQENEGSNIFMISEVNLANGQGN